MSFLERKKIEDQFDFVDKIYILRQEIHDNGSNSKMKHRKIHQTKYKRNIEEKNDIFSCYIDGYQKHKRETSQNTCKALL